MQYKEYGSHNTRTIILLHGGGFSWWNYRDEAELLQNDFRVILPMIDGHAGSDRPFVSIAENAKEIIAFIDQNLNGRVTLLGGLSLGAQIAVEILTQRRDVCGCALIESACVRPDRLTESMIAPAFGSSYGLISKRWFAKMQFASFKLRDSLFEDYYRDSCAIAKEDMIAFMKDNSAYALRPQFSENEAYCRITVGSKEGSRMLKSAEMIHEAAGNSTLVIQEGLYHGQFSLNEPGRYADTVRDIIASHE